MVSNFFQATHRSENCGRVYRLLALIHTFVNRSILVALQRINSRGDQSGRKKPQKIPVTVQVMYDEA